jgi:hypothetical protein
MAHMTLLTRNVYLRHHGLKHLQASFDRTAQRWRLEDGLHFIYEGRGPAAKMRRRVKLAAIRTCLLRHTDPPSDANQCFLWHDGRLYTLREVYTLLPTRESLPASQVSILHSHRDCK